MFYILHPNQTMECQAWLLMDEEKCPDSPNNSLYYPHIIILAIQLQQKKSRTASTRLDLPVCTLVTSNTLKRFSREPYSTSPTHAGTRVCVRRKWRQAQAQDSTGQGQVFCLEVLPRWACLRKISSGSGCSLFLFFLSFSLNSNFDFFSLLRRAEVR